MIAAARLPLRSDPANNQFERPSAHGRIWLSGSQTRLPASNLRIPRHPATQSALIWPGIPRPSGHLFHGHPAGQSERSDAGVALLVRVGWRRQFLRPFAH